MIKRKGSAAPEKAAPRPEESLPVLRDVLETHRMEVDGGVHVDQLAEWVAQESPNFDWKQFGFQEFGELLNFAQDKLLVRLEPNQDGTITVGLGAEFHPPAVPNRNRKRYRKKKWTNSARRRDNRPQPVPEERKPKKRVRPEAIGGGSQQPDAAAAAASSAQERSGVGREPAPAGSP
jgi:hypothetical protein